MRSCSRFWNVLSSRISRTTETRGFQGKTSGQLHNETAYGLVNLVEDGPSCVVRRKKLSTVKRKEELEAVRDSRYG